MVGDGLKFHADLVAQPFVVRNGFIRNVARKLRVRKTAARLHDVAVKEVGVILDAGFFLHVGAGCGNGAAVNDGVAAVGGHLVYNEHAFHALFMGFKSRGKACKACTDDEEIDGAVPLLRCRNTGHGGRSHRTQPQGSGGTQK